MMGIIRHLLLSALLAGVFIQLSGGQAFAQNERYKAIPMYGGGIFIIDTREGHTWTWSNNAGKVSKDGKSERLKYQGNVIKNIGNSKVEVIPKESSTRGF